MIDKAYIEAMARRMHPDMEWPTPSDEVRELMDRYKVSDQYEELADWFCTRGVATAYGGSEHISVTAHHYVDGKYSIDTEATRKRLARIVQAARAKGLTVTKDYSDDYFKIRIEFPSGARITYIAARQTVCTPKVVGKKLIPAQPARYVDEVEYDCERISLLAYEVD